MAETPPEPAPKPAKKKGRLKLIVGALCLVGLGGGGAYGAAAMGYFGGHSDGGAAKSAGPQLIRKGEEDPYAPPSEEEGSGVAEVDGEGGSQYRTTYFAFEEPFTANLKDSPALVQTTLAASTRRDGRVLMWLHKHELALRSQILVELANTPEDDVYSVAGKERLQRRLTAAINRKLIETEGFGGVDAVYFRGFLVQ